MTMITHHATSVSLALHRFLLIVLYLQVLLVFLSIRLNNFIFLLFVCTLSLQDVDL